MNSLRLLLALAVTATAAAAQTGEAADPADPVDRALAWLAPRLAGVGALHAGSANAGGKLDVTRSVSSWILEETPGQDEHAGLREELRRRVRETARGGGGVATLSFASWLLGFAGFPLYERAAREGRASPALRSLVRGVAERQNAEGGWGHGGGFEPEFYPTTLIATTNLAILTLGMGRRHDVRTAEDELELALELVRDVQGPGGGLPYGGRMYRKGFESGRTAGTVVAYAAAGENGASLRSAAAYLLRNLRRIPRGHASPAVHVLLGAAACRVLGEEAWRRYDAAVLADVRAAQRDDGSFADILGTSPDTMSLMGAAELNTAYVTALYAAALAVPRSRWIAELEKEIEPVSAEDADDASDAARPAPRPAWTRDVRARAVAVADGRVLWVEDCDGGTRLVAADAATGGAARTITLPATEGRRFLQRAGTGRLRLLALPDIDDDAPTASSLTPDDEESAAPASEGRLFDVDLAAGEVSWSADLAGDVDVVLPAGDEILVMQRMGDVSVLSAAAGSVVRRIRKPGVGLNSAVAPIGGGETIYARGSRLWRIGGTGEERWFKRARGRRGVARPAFGAVAVSGGVVIAGTTAGRVSVRDVATGRTKGPILELGASVGRILAARDDPELFVVVTGDHRVHAVRGGERIWTHDASGGRESHTLPGVVLGRDVVWVGSRAGGSLAALDLEGRVLFARPLEAGAVWAAEGRTAIVAAGGVLGVHRLP